MFISEALAAAGNPVGAMSTDIGRLLFQFGIIIFVFYIFLIRPQSRKIKDHQLQVANLQKGDKVVTQGGIVGKVQKVEDDEIVLEISENVNVRVVKDKIASVAVFEKSDKKAAAELKNANENAVAVNKNKKEKSTKMKEILS